MTFFKKDESKNKAENPYLSARKTWNNLTSSAFSERDTWRIVGLLGLMIGLGGVGGITYIGSQSKFIPYVIEVNKLGEALAVAPAQKAGKPDIRVVHASVASFISDLRMVTPDIALQRKAILRAYAMLSRDDPATAKANELYGTEDSNPFKRATTEIVNTEIETAIQQSDDTWQVDWIETVRDRQGVVKGKPFRMRALVTVYTAAPTSKTTEEEERKNPLGIYVRDFSWSKQV